MMKAIRLINQKPLPSAAQLVPSTFPIPELKRGEILVKNTHIGINFIDVYHRTGLYPAAGGLLGMEGIGTVERVAGEEDKKQWLGKKGVYNTLGSYAEYTAVPTSAAIPLPDDVEETTVLCLMLQGMTAHFLTHDVTQIDRNSTVLIHAAGGGTGNLAVQLAARVKGARVIGTASASKLARGIEAGAAEMIDYTHLSPAELTAAVLKSAGPRRVDVSIDGVGKRTYETSLDVLRERGMAIFFGNASGPIPKIDLLSLSTKGSLYVTRPTLVHYTRGDEMKRRMNELLRYVKEGKLVVGVDTVFEGGLEDVARAQAKLESGQSSGKIVVRLSKRAEGSSGSLGKGRSNL